MRRQDGKEIGLASEMIASGTDDGHGAGQAKQQSPSDSKSHGWDGEPRGKASKAERTAATLSYLPARRVEKRGG